MNSPNQERKSHVTMTGDVVLHEDETRDNGSLDLEKTTSTSKANRRETLGMRDFFRESHIRESTASLMMYYDKDGDGSFSKEEVVEIIKDLQAQNRTSQDLALANKILKRLLVGAVIFFFLLVVSIFGLTFAVANLTKDTSVDTTTGTMYAKDSQTVVATNSRADVFLAESYEFGDCLMTSDVNTIKRNILEGKNIVLQINDEMAKNVTLEQLVASGASLEHEVSATGDVMVDDGGKVCFVLPEANPPGSYYCIEQIGPDHPCHESGAARRLVDRTRARALQAGRSGDATAAPVPAPTFAPQPLYEERELAPAFAPVASVDDGETISAGSRGCC